ncbi:MAG: formylmethanofuran dehydrogenase subunit B [Syntrophales bacterium]
MTKTVCTGCSCLCDDIGIEREGQDIARIENACVKGSSIIRAADDIPLRVPYLIGKREVTLEQAIDKTAGLLKNSKHPLIFGFDNSTLEAQAFAIELARALGGVIDDCSSFCHGELVLSILNGTIPSCSLSEVKDAEMIMYWGANPYHSHPRHLSKFSYYAHEKYNPAGWSPDVTLVSIEVRDTETTFNSRPFFKILPGEDGKLISSILATMKGQGDRGDAKDIVDLIRQKGFCVIFVGLGLVYALDGDLSLFNEMVHMLSKETRISVMPMVGHFNMRGFNHRMFQQTGYINKVSFANGVSHGPEFSMLEQVKNNDPDCILIAGADPFTSLPSHMANNLKNVPIIALDPFITPTTQASAVVFGTAISGVETWGTAMRMDGLEVPLVPAWESGRLSDEQILKLLLDEVTR